MRCKDRDLKTKTDLKASSKWKQESTSIELGGTGGELWVVEAVKLKLVLAKYMDSVAGSCSLFVARIA